MSAGQSRHDLRIEHVDEDAPKPRPRPTTAAVAQAVVGRLGRSLALLVGGYAGGAGTVLVLPGDPPAATAPVERETRSTSEQRLDVDACRLAGDYARAAAQGCGVDEQRLDELARERLGPPPPFSRGK